MFRAFHSARRKSSLFAMAVALAGGSVLAATAVSAPAYAQDESESVSAGFFEVYQPVANLTQGETPNWEGARAQIPAVQAAIENAMDRFAAGNLTLVIGNNLNDPVLQRQGLELMLDSGRADPERVPRFHMVAASLAMNAGDFAAARMRAQAAIDAGYSDGDTAINNDPEYLIMTSYFDEDDIAGGVAYVLREDAARQATGGLPEQMLRNALQQAYNTDDIANSDRLNFLILERAPTEVNWTNALRIYYQLNDLDEQMNVDTLRLLHLTGADLQRPEYSTLVDELDARRMGNEVLAVLNRGLAEGIYTSDDPYYSELRSTAETRARADRAEMAAIISDGNSGNVLDAIASANVLYSLENYAEAATLFELAANNSADPNLALTRLGMTQVQMGDYATAQETFARVTGPRTALARYWSTYAAWLATQ